MTVNRDDNGHDTDRIESAARKLATARETGVPVSPLTLDWPDLDEEAAYRIGRRVVALGASPVVGFKLGYTSEAMRAQMNVASPNYGALTSAAAATGDIAMRTLIHPLVEPEIALVLGRAIEDESPTIAEIRRAVAFVAPAIEVVDTRYVSYAFAAVDNIADNSSSARFVVGPQRKLTADLDLRKLVVTLRNNGHACDTGIGADALGGPLVALQWFASLRYDEGRPLNAGDIILTGGLTRAYPVAAGDVISADFGTFGSAQARFV